MTDAFSDIESTPSDSDTSSETESPNMVTDTDISTVFNDDVRATTPDPEEINDTKLYRDPDSDEEADDVDPRGLFRTPDINELRYYARQGPYGKTVVTKPLRDAFKHGFEVVGDNTERNDDEQGRIGDFLDEYADVYKKAERKARRDGICVIMHQIADNADSAAEPIQAPQSDASLEGFQLWTVDNLSDDLSASEVAQNTEYSLDEVYVSEGAVNGGIALVDDVSHPNHGDIIGYGVEPRQDSEDHHGVSFIHADRCQHLVWGEWVDGQLGNNVTGEHVGESVLTPIIEPLKASQMGYWAMKNILFRYSAPLHAVEPPESWGQDEYDTFTEKLTNLSAASDATLPPGAELSVAEGVSEFDPQPIYEVLVESVCAATVFSKPILQGTQTGTVSGSETDVKTYFHEIHLLRTERIESKFREAVRMVSNYDQSTIPRVADPDGYEIEWGPLFKLTDAEMAEGMVSVVTAATNAIKNYVLTPDEARSVMEEQWAKFDADVDLEDLDESDWDDLDRINIREAGRGPQDDEPVNQERIRENPQMQNGGGQPAGQTRESSQPTRDDAIELSEAAKDDIAARIVEQLTDE